MSEAAGYAHLLPEALSDLEGILVRLVSTGSKAAEDSLLDIFRADAKVLQKLRHPGIVRVVEPLDEGKWAMAMVTEPVFSSVANALGNLENMSSIPPELEKLVSTDFHSWCPSQQVLCTVHGEQASW